MLVLKMRMVCRELPCSIWCTTVDIIGRRFYKCLIKLNNIKLYRGKLHLDIVGLTVLYYISPSPL